ncbi:PREDICTED: interleukin-17F-like [Nanorana parkeri]|uniref:interleukin-17F-like n=1 Tax=Nanorana parkeri TaxID=125878 RepID=UPI0008549694|nr:PREDICTED: interleukin-17F-like [Nanorana parkeri]
MDHTRATMIQLTILVFLLGDSLLVPIAALDLHHLKKGGCPPITKFPSSVKVNLNIIGQEAPAMSGDVRKRSISPWEYSYDVNNNRFPSTIAEARCLHTGCLDTEGNVDISLNSVPIKQEILVVYKEMKGCVPTFKLEKKMVTVGCTCARPKVYEQ